LFLRETKKRAPSHIRGLKHPREMFKAAKFHSALGAFLLSRMTILGPPSHHHNLSAEHLLHPICLISVFIFVTNQAAMSRSNGYHRAKAQLQRDAIKSPGLTLRNVLKAFGAFARDFENFERPENLENSDNPEDPKEVVESEVVRADNADSFLSETSSCPDESDSSSEGSTSSLDEMALIYADFEDMESELEGFAFFGTASQVDEASSVMGEENSVIEGITSPVQLAMDETKHLCEVSASAPLPAPRAVLPAVSSGFFDDPISFVVHTGVDGSITTIETEHYEIRYQYQIDLKPKQVLDLESLCFFIEVIEWERVISSALLKFLTITADVQSMTDLKNPDAKITWLPTLLRDGVSETVHELVYICLHFCLGKVNTLSRATLRYLAKSLPKAGFGDLNKEDIFIPMVRELLDEFSDVSRTINHAEIRLFLYLNNNAILPDVLSLASHSDMRLYCKIK
jgi:hypothetical protein